MAPFLNSQQARTTRAKNLSTSFGLTLVVGLPFASEILEQAAQLRAQTEALVPGRFRWYAPDHLHATVMAPLRGRYREGPPLQRNELPADLEGFVEALNQCFAALEPFPLKLDRLCLAPDGRLLALGADPGRVRPQVAERLVSLDGLDRPKSLDNWHVTLSYLQIPAPFAPQAEQAGFGVDWGELQAAPLGAMEVDQVWLVHYAKRTLSQIVGKAPLQLGRPNALTEDSFMTVLGIGRN